MARLIKAGDGHIHKINSIVQKIVRRTASLRTNIKMIYMLNLNEEVCKSKTSISVSWPVALVAELYGYNLILKENNRQKSELGAAL